MTLSVRCMEYKNQKKHKEVYSFFVFFGGWRGGEIGRGGGVVKKTKQTGNFCFLVNIKVFSFFSIDLLGRSISHYFTL